ncbi:serine phosphatase RsbU (regulator of sigma subunit) [Motilibacter rhizosphaerae]|uniref:Serine phosphatase RsbU (Regulator of sigma subunit) n=1 Tax=Motilibacter rhizosphaerae TaxID=598652 RepID=A0A4Q7NT08_9ACTN|nr:SpoIIE family protein phosphatase [Motilibacter rhizosphaerae]RZS90010.1 serine phosphatase RsbU (regulator of sigma subunit) [Motilibacter rhizosphaerae]
MQVSALLDATDWASTPLGEPATWPAGLHAVVSTVLGSPLPMALALGPEAVLVYSDAYAALLGAKHPECWARPAREVFPENWDLPGHGDVVERVRLTGEAFSETSTLLPVRRQGPDGPVEHVHFARAYTPARSDDGEVLGVLSVVVESSESARAVRTVAELASRLSSAASVDDVAREALRHAVEAVASDHARVVLLEGTALRITRRAGIEEQDESTRRLPLLWSRLSASAALPSVEVSRTGRPMWLAAGDLDAYPSLRDEPLSAPLRSVACVPLSSSEVQGALSLGWEQDRVLTTEEQAALLTAASLVGQALARAQRFDEQRGNAELLQRSMLPAEMPHVPGLSIGARYVPSAPGTSAGGDFYDAFSLADGRLLLAIGDVVGHGVLAATVMGQVRAALRVVALREDEPTGILAALDPFVTSLGPETFVTAFVAVLDPATGALRAATAGHPPPLLRRAQGGRGGEFLDVPAGPPLGLPAPRAATDVVLRDGDLLLMFTDGLVEVPGQHLDLGLDRLRETVAGLEAYADPRRACARVLDEMGAGTDDIALVAVGVEPGERRVGRVELPAESTSAGQARSWLRRTLTAIELPESVVEVALLCTSELVTNALLHARSGATVEADVDPHRLLVLVSDQGMSTLPAAQAAEPAAVRGRGLALVEALADAWGTERTSRGTTVWFELGRPGR